MTHLSVMLTKENRARSKNCKTTVNKACRPGYDLKCSLLSHHPERSEGSPGCRSVLNQRDPSLRSG